VNRLLLNITIVLSLMIIIVACGHDKTDSALLTQIDSEPLTLKDFKKENMTMQEFISWCAIPENKLVQEKSVSEVIYQLSFVPQQQMALMELGLGPNDTLKTSVYNEALKHYSAMTYFNLKIKVPSNAGEALKYNLTSSKEYEERIKYAAFNMEHDVTLIQDSNKLSPGLFHFERAFETNAYLNFMLAFDNKNFLKDKAFTIQFQDELFKKGNINFKFTEWQLINLPTIINL
jgi:hypothetical protein